MCLLFLGIFLLFYICSLKTKNNNIDEFTFSTVTENVAEPKTAYKLTKRHIISLAECSLSYNGVRYECTIV